jgi:hypothetical protein
MICKLQEGQQPGSATVYVCVCVCVCVGMCVGMFVCVCARGGGEGRVHSQG